MCQRVFLLTGKSAKKKHENKPTPLKEKTYELYDMKNTMNGIVNSKMSGNGFYNPLFL